MSVCGCAWLGYCWRWEGIEAVVVFLFLINSWTDITRRVRLQLLYQVMLSSFHCRGSVQPFCPGKLLACLFFHGRLYICCRALPLTASILRCTPSVLKYVGHFKVFRTYYGCVEKTLLLLIIIHWNSIWIIKYILIKVACHIPMHLPHIHLLYMVALTSFYWERLKNDAQLK